MPDSIWNFYDVPEQLTVRKHFVAGEVTTIERIQNNSILETKDIETRASTVLKQYALLSALALLMILIMTRLVMNIRRSGRKDIIVHSTFATIAQILLLPTFIFILAMILSSFVSESTYNLFAIPGELIVTNIVMIPVLTVVFYGLKLRTRYDIVLYILLFTFLIIWIQEFYFLKQLIV